MAVFITLTKAVSRNKIAIPVGEIEIYEEVDEKVRGAETKVVKVHYDREKWAIVSESFETVDKMVYDGVRLSQLS